MNGINLAISVFSAIIIMSLAVIAQWKYNKFKKAEKEKTLKETVQTIISAIEHGSVSKIEDIHDLCLGIYNKQIVNVKRHEDVTHILRKAKVVLSKKPDPEKNRKVELAVINEMLKESKALYEKQVQSDPFSGVPSPERSLLEDIHEISGASEKEILRDKLSELSSAIKIREETQQKFTDDQRQSLKVAKRGFYATLTMSGVSIALAIWFFLLSRSSG